jgi:4-aminobutyrate aminotransferase
LSFKLTMGNVLTLTPPLIITKTQIDLALKIIDQSLSEAEQALSIM